MKKWLSMFLAAVMLCGVLAGCGGTQSGSTPASGAQSASAAGDSNVNAEGFPIVNEPITLRGMVALNANVKDWNEHPALKRMEELTGIHIEWECVPDAGFTEKRNLAFASDDLPDIILRAKISPQEEMKYAANGQLVALDEYLDYAPNLSALIEQDDAIRKGITMPDGHIIFFRLYTASADCVRPQDKLRHDRPLRGGGLCGNDLRLSAPNGWQTGNIKHIRSFDVRNLSENRHQFRQVVEPHKAIPHPVAAALRPQLKHGSPLGEVGDPGIEIGPAEPLQLLRL